MRKQERTRYKPEHPLEDPALPPPHLEKVELGLLPKKVWVKMTREQREAYLATRRAIEDAFKEEERAERRKRAGY